MSYLYKELCFPAVSDVYASMASDCPVTTDSGLTEVCVPTSSGFDVYINNHLHSSVSFTPISCTPDYSDALLLSSAILGVLLLAWSIKVLTKVL
jgi:hypothetical protein